jgi:hypothetical protein
MRLKTRRDGASEGLADMIYRHYRRHTKNDAWMTFKLKFCKNHQNHSSLLV